MSRGVKKGSKRGSYKRREREKRYVCSCSFGKDSLATVLLALEHGEPLDAVVFCEVMYDLERGISGEDRSHIEWVKSVAIPRLECMGVRCVHIRGGVDYVSSFRKEIGSGVNSGKKRGFPIARMCCIQRECKVLPIRKWYKDEYFSKGYDVVEYVGIAADEPERLMSLRKSDSVRISKESLLARYGYTETMALLKCAEYDLLSPIYFSPRGNRNGCWFCPNQGVSAFCGLRRESPELWGELKALDKEDNLASRLFKYDMSVSDVERKMDEYEEKYSELLWR